MPADEDPTSRPVSRDVRHERDELLARQQVLLTELVHRDPHAPEARARATTEALTEVRARLAELRDLEDPDDPDDP